MNSTGKLNQLALAVAIGSALVMAAGQAKAGAAAQATSSTNQNAGNGSKPKSAAKKGATSSTTPATTLSEIVVTGAPTFNGVKRVDASFSITTATLQQIKEANPVSIADLLKISPGVFAESSGGQTGANIEVAGFPSDSGAPFATFELEGMPLFPRWSYFEDAMMRLDDTIYRVELLQGGPSVLYGNGQPGLIANFRLRQGTPTPSGDVGLTLLSEGGERIDGFYGLPVGSSGWLASVGGFWRKSDGVRNPQFPADKGGQVTMTLSRDLDNGSIMFYARYLNDKNQFVTDTPIFNPAPGQFSPWPGFDPLTGTFGSKADQYQVWQTAPCFTNGCTPPGLDLNLANGRGGDLRIFGGTFFYDFGNGWTLSNNFQAMTGNINNIAYYSTGENPMPLSAFISSQESYYNLPAGLTPEVRYTTGGTPSMDEMISVQNPEFIRKHPKSIGDELHVSKELFDGNTLTVGTYLAAFSDRHYEYDGWNQVLQAKSNPTPIMVDLTGGGQTYAVTDSQGLFANYPQSWMAFFERWHETTEALFATDTWHIGNWWLSGGARVQHVNVGGEFQGQTSGDLDANPLTLYNNTSEYLINSFTHPSYNKSAPSWTAGATYAFNNNMSAYARVNDGVFMPGFDDVVALPTVPVEKIHNMEVGFKYQAPWIFLDVSAYRRLFYGIPYVFDQPNGGQINLVYGSSTKGLDLQTIIKPFENFSVTVVADYMEGHYDHHEGCVPYTAQDGSTQCGIIDGKVLDRQPKIQYRVTPAYVVPTGWGHMKFWFTFEHIGGRFGDQLNQQPLGSYHDFAIGALADIGKNWELMLRGTNVTNQLGITEGNARLFGFASGGGVILARSIQGREVNFQVKYKF